MNKTLYIQCNMGAAGDMLNAALYELLDDDKKAEYLRLMNRIIPGVTVTAESVSKCGIFGTHMLVLIDGTEEGHDHEHHHHDHDHDHEHHHGHSHSDDCATEHTEHVEKHSHTHEHHHDHDHEHHHEHYHDHDHHHSHHHHAGLTDVETIINAAGVSTDVIAKALSVYKLIAEAEGQAHNKDITEIHFHEVGTKDAIADVLGACYLIELLGNPKVIVSDINTGFGNVKCAHGILPVPAPATAYILKDAPIYQGQYQGEMCTPTGAALLMTLKCDFGRMPVMTIEGCGYGMGRKDFPEANCVRAFIGTEKADNRTETITGLSCNVDDMTGEEIAFAKEVLLAAGALDVYSFTTDMKKGRPGTELVCITKPEDEERMIGLIMANTSSWGVRKQSFERFYMDRHIEAVETEYGPVRVKIGQGFGTSKWKPEYEDIAEISRREGISMAKVNEAVVKAIACQG